MSHTADIRKNIPKSGWSININEINERKNRFTVNDKSFLILYLTNSKPLNITNEGFRNSEGCTEKYINFIHRVAPLVSWENKRTKKQRIIEKINKEIEKIISFFIDNFEINKIVKILMQQKSRCLFHRIFDFKFVSPGCWEALEIAITPIKINIKIGNKIVLSILSHQLTYNLLFFKIYSILDNFFENFSSIFKIFKLIKGWCTRRKNNVNLFRRAQC